MTETQQPSPAAPVRCSECGGPTTPCESCPHGEGDVLCDNSTSSHYGEHVAPLGTS